MPIVEHQINLDKQLKSIRGHFERHKFAYGLGAGIVIAGFTSVIIGSVASSVPIGRGVTVTAKRGITVLGRRVEMNNVSVFASNRQGAPSWVVRCMETNGIFSSQLSAAKEMGIDASTLSKHLNGVFPHAQGYHFERICMAA